MVPPTLNQIMKALDRYYKAHPNEKPAKFDQTAQEIENDPKYEKLVESTSEGGSPPYKHGDWKKANELIKQIKPTLFNGLFKDGGVRLLVDAATKLLDHSDDEIKEKIKFLGALADSGLEVGKNEFETRAIEEILESKAAKSPELQATVEKVRKAFLQNPPPQSAGAKK